jgi:microcystin-dependent protein
MAEPFLSEIRIMSFPFAPQGWAQCDGQLMLVSQNQALFQLLGTTFGGNGDVTFALPDLRRRVPIHVGNGHKLGELGGEDVHTLSVQELAGHLHLAQVSSANAGGNDNPTGRVPGGANNLWHTPTALTPMNPTTVTSTGGGQPHQNLMPFLTLNFCIALQGADPAKE